MDRSPSIIKTQFCTFWIADYLYGIKLLDMKEVCQDVKVTQISQASDYIKGYMNIRGQIYLVLDLRVMLGFPPREVAPDHCVIIFKSAIGEFFGILVDGISGVEEVDTTQIEMSLQKGAIEMGSDTYGIGSDIIQGIYRLRQRLLVLINSNMLLRKIG